MGYRLLISALAFTISLSLFAKGKVVATVELSPIGSFEVKSQKVRGKITKNSDGSFSAKKITVKVSSLKSGIDLRDEHLHKSMLGKEHKKVILTKAVASNGKGKGYLEIRGVKRPIKFTYKESGKKLKISFSVNLTKYKFEDINYKGVGVEEKLKIIAEVDYK